MKNLKIIIAILAVLITNLGYGQLRYKQIGTDIIVDGDNNFATAVQSALASVPNLRPGNVSYKANLYALTSITPEVARIIIEGQLSIDYFDITMPDGKVFRFNYSSDGFVYSGEWPRAMDGTPILNKNLRISGIRLNNAEKTEPTYISHAHLVFNKINVAEAGSKRHNDNANSIRSVDIVCSSADPSHIESIKNTVEHLREEYNILTKHWANKKTNTKQQAAPEEDGFDGMSGNSSKQSNERKTETAETQNNIGEQVELDFWGNPITKKAGDGRAETVNHGGMEVQDNEHYRTQMALRDRNASARRAWEDERAADRKRVDDHNDAIYQQAQRGIEQTDRDIAEMDNAIGQLDYSSGKSLLESSGNLARAATATGNVGQAKGALIGMGVGAALAIGEGAAKRKAAREAREKRERLEKERVAKLKLALRNARTSVLNHFESGELPLSSTKSRENNLYYFVYALDRNQIEENSCKVYASNVFAIGRYPDGTWPMKTKIEQELNALTPLEEVIHGPYPSFEEAQRSHEQFVNYAKKARMEIVEVEHKGFNVQASSGNRPSTGPALDFFGNPINPKKETQTKQPQKTNTPSQKTQQTELDFWGNPVKK